MLSRHTRPNRMSGSSDSSPEGQVLNGERATPVVVRSLGKDLPSGGFRISDGVNLQLWVFTSEQRIGGR